MRRISRCYLRLIVFLVMLAGSSARSEVAVTSWAAIFKGIDYCLGTNTPGGDLPHLHVVHAMRVDLTDPDIRLFTSPPISNYVANVRETAGRTVSSFLTTYHLQAAVNANGFDPTDYYLPTGTPMAVLGLAISEGRLVSAQESSEYASALIFDSTNHPTVIHTNWPPVGNDGIFTAVSGLYPVVVHGVNIGRSYQSIGGFVHQSNPRTLFGVSQDNRFLYLLTIDGRQPGYSTGANDFEAATWMLLLGSYEAVNLDGGGSTTLVMEDSTGQPVTLNSSSAVADSGRQRTVGSHFGVFAKPVPAFINEVEAVPDDTTARISWTTMTPASAKVQYGLTTNLENASILDPGPATNHVVMLTGLTPATQYYFKAFSAVGDQEYLSLIRVFTTTNYVTTNLIVGLTNSWNYATTNLDGVNWTALDYDDSGWSGPGPGLLWIDVRPSGPDPDVGPRNTEMPANLDNNGFPFTTYYFRSHFSMSNSAPVESLAFTSYLDDGAVFYLNGKEVYRIRMDSAPLTISNNSLATGFPCAGDATCSDEFSLSGDLLSALSPGDNVLAIEVHNSDPRSPDITFGTTVVAIRSAKLSPHLVLTQVSNGAALSWTGDGFVLQHADDATGPWADIDPALVSNPFLISKLGGTQFYRLRK